MPEATDSWERHLQQLRFMGYFAMEDGAITGGFDDLTMKNGDSPVRYVK